jgi:long-subunit fatty acid transport protein
MWGHRLAIGRRSGDAVDMKLQASLLVSVSAVLTACQGSVYRADVGAQFSSVRGRVALQNSAGNLDLGSNQMDLDRDFGMSDTEPSPYLRLQMDNREHRVRGSAFGVDAEGSGTIGADRAYGDIGASTDVDVRTSLEFINSAVAYSYNLSQNRKYRLGVGGQLAFNMLDVAAFGTSFGREEVETDVLVPMPYLDAEAMFDQGSIGGSFGLMSADLGDANGRYMDIELYGRWQLTKEASALVGYRYLVLDSYGDASGRDFDADLEIQGLFVAAGIKF